MRSKDRRSGGLLSYVDLEARVPEEHPLQTTRMMLDDAVSALSGELKPLYLHPGRPSIPPERLLLALVLQTLYSVRSERLLIEHLDCNLLFRSLVGLEIDDPVSHPTAFTTERDRLLEREVAIRFLAGVLNHVRLRRLLTRGHFSVDGSLIETWASMKSFRGEAALNQPPGIGRNASRDFHCERRRNDTHASTTDLDARMVRKQAPQRAEGRPSWSRSLGRAEPYRRLPERLAAVALGARCAGSRPITWAPMKAMTPATSALSSRELGTVPHLAQHATGRRSTMDCSTTQHLGYRQSRQARHRSEEVFASVKIIAGQSKDQASRPRNGALALCPGERIQPDPPVLSAPS
jgi:transposase